MPTQEVSTTHIRVTTSLRIMPRVALFAYGGSDLCRLGSGELWCMVHVV